jgi:transcriptional regulator with GAF, ATPase, and Fis domain
VPREQVLARAFVELADTLVAGFDVADFLHLLATRCVQLLDVQAAALMLADQDGQLRVMASSSRRAHLLELFELDTDKGPCLDCFSTGQPTTDTYLGDPDPRWPRLGQHAREAGFQSVHALPMRLRDDIIGVVTLLSTSARPLLADDSSVGQALADVATIGLLQRRAIQDGQSLSEQLQGALDSRVVIEQAKGVLTERLHIDAQEAFDMLRTYARRHNQRIAGVAREIIDGTIDITQLWIPQTAGAEDATREKQDS